MNDIRLIGFFSDENSTVTACKCMNKEYPKVHFEAVDLGHEKYKVTVASEGVIGHTILENFKNCFWILYISIPHIQER